MKLAPKAIEKYGKLLLLVLIVFEVVIVLVYLAGILLTGKAYPAFDMNGQMTVSSYLQALQLFLIGAIAIIVLICGRQSSRPPSQVFSFTVAVLFTYASVDEIFKIHLQLHSLLNTPHHKDWMPIYLGIGVSTLVVFHRDFIALWHFHRKAISFVAVGMGIFILGGFGAEVLKILFNPLLTQTFGQGGTITLLVENLRIAIEEFSELLGESLTLYGLCLFLGKRLEQQL
ncbi:MAG TPA: hypothetical protein DC064_09855 [Cyanobacteria bacterium UBA9273]|nr:hypothetical protein [Cyanobacteria bacterium UBA9273]